MKVPTIKKEERTPHDICEERVRRGVAWLHKHAPGWQRRMFTVIGEENGRLGAIFRAKNCRDDECVLALAFELQPKFANEAGHVTYASVLRHFDLSSKQIVDMGFDLSTDDDTELEEYLDAAWCQALLTYARPHVGAVRHALRTKAVA